MHEFDDWVAEDMGFALDADDFDPNDAFKEVELWLEDNGHKVVHQRAGVEYDDYISGMTNYTKWSFTYLPDEDVWEFEWDPEWGAE